MDDEENRVLDLYREKVIPVEKVREQMGEERQSLVTAPAKNPEPDLNMDHIVQYCELITKRLKGLSGDFEGKRHLAYW
ncbi:MAG: hypothetical protein ABIJ00_01740 [Candidatus Eisenbacteria bacterium]